MTRPWVHPRVVHRTLALLWCLAYAPTLVWWRDSVLWVAAMSLYANVASELAAAHAATGLRDRDLDRIAERLAAERHLEVLARSTTVAWRGGPLPGVHLHPRAHHGGGGRSKGCGRPAARPRPRSLPGCTGSAAHRRTTRTIPQPVVVENDSHRSPRIGWGREAPVPVQVKKKPRKPKRPW